MTKLESGPPPNVDTIVGSTLFHEGKAILLDRAGAGAQALGSLDGTPYIAASNQIYRVGDDGSLTAIGTPHETYSQQPRMSTATGHVFFSYISRTGPGIFTVVDARTGGVLNVQDGGGDDRPLDPADLPVAAVSGGHVTTQNGDGAALAVSPDGLTGLNVTVDQGDEDLPRANVVEEWSLGARPSVVRRLTFPLDDPRFDEISIDDVVFEDEDTLLARAYEPIRLSGHNRIRTFVVRCTLKGACERATKTVNGALSIAGAGGVFVPGRFPDN